jgi:hypothetical protein
MMPIWVDRWSAPKLSLLEINQHLTKPLTATFALNRFGNCEHTKVVRDRSK